jgi:CO dehydrogenase maturation factor
MLHQVKTSLVEGGAAMGGLPGGVSKREYLEYHVRTALAEGSRFDLIAMGRGEGQGCYCAVNHNLREVIDALSRHYAYVVIDNEAGMEHLSRRTTRDVQHLLVVSDPSQRGLVAAQRIAEMRKELDIHVDNAYLIVNRVPNGELPEQIRAFIDTMDIPLLGTIPSDTDLAEFEFSGRPLIDLGNDSPVYQAVSQMTSSILAP